MADTRVIGLAWALRLVVMLVLGASSCVTHAALPEEALLIREVEVVDPAEIQAAQAAAEAAQAAAEAARVAAGAGAEREVFPGGEFDAHAAVAQVAERSRQLGMDGEWRSSPNISTAHLEPVQDDDPRSPLIVKVADIAPDEEAILVDRDGCSAWTLSSGGLNRVWVSLSGMVWIQLIAPPADWPADELVGQALELLGTECRG